MVRRVCGTRASLEYILARPRAHSPEGEPLVEGHARRARRREEAQEGALDAAQPSGPRDADELRDGAQDVEAVSLRRKGSKRKRRDGSRCVAGMRRG
jgi:hypothetical protein